MTAYEQEEQAFKAFDEWRGAWNKSHSDVEIDEEKDILELIEIYANEQTSLTTA